MKEVVIEIRFLPSCFQIQHLTKDRSLLHRWLERLTQDDLSRDRQNPRAPLAI